MICSNFFFIPFSLPSRSSAPGSLSRLFSPLPATCAPLFLSREDCSPFFPRRLASNCVVLRRMYSFCCSVAFSSVLVLTRANLWRHIVAQTRCQVNEYCRFDLTSLCILAAFVVRSALVQGIRVVPLRVLAANEYSRNLGKKPGYSRVFGLF